MLVRPLSYCAVAVLCLTPLCLAQDPTFYVSPDGDDSWSGRLPEANARKTDGPLATLERARDAIRELKSSRGLPEAACIVELRGGVYELSQPFELGEEDSGTPKARIVYRGRQGEEVRLVAGKRVDRFQPVDDPAVLDMLDPAARGSVVRADLRALGIDDFGPVDGGGIEVFFGDKAMTLARWPNEGFVRIVEMVGQPVRNGRHMTHTKGIFVYDGDRPKRWTGEKDVWVHGYWFHDWADQHHRVKRIDTESRTIEVEPPYHGYGYRKGKWYYALNLLSELDTPGEWYLDRESGTLYFWPPGPLAGGNTTVSVHDAVIKLQNVSHVTVRRLTMEAAAGTAVTVRGGLENEIVGCTFRILGGWAVSVSGGQRHGVVGCDVYETGRGGIALSGGDRKTLTPAGHYAENNHIHHYARVKRVYQPGITLQGVGNRASHNLIHNAPHMGDGFRRQRPPHRVERNPQRLLRVERRRRHLHGPQLDDARHRDPPQLFAPHLRVREPRLRRRLPRRRFQRHARSSATSSTRSPAPPWSGGGRDNTIENNVFVDCRPAIHVDARGIGWANQYIVPGGGWQMQQKLKDVNHDRPPYAQKYPHLAEILEDEPYVPKYTLVARNIVVGDAWDSIQKPAQPYVTMENNLIGKDPHFVDAAGGDFRLREDSPAFELGFQRIPCEKIGLYEDPSRASWPVVHSVR